MATNSKPPNQAFAAMVSRILGTLSLEQAAIKLNHELTPMTLSRMKRGQVGRETTVRKFAEGFADRICELYGDEVRGIFGECGADVAAAWLWAKANGAVIGPFVSRSTPVDMGRGETRDNAELERVVAATLQAMEPYHKQLVQDERRKGRGPAVRSVLEKLLASRGASDVLRKHPELAAYLSPRLENAPGAEQLHFVAEDLCLNVPEMEELFAAAGYPDWTPEGEFERLRRRLGELYKDPQSFAEMPLPPRDILRRMTAMQITQAISVIEITFLYTIPGYLEDSDELGPAVGIRSEVLEVAAEIRDKSPLRDYLNEVLKGIDAAHPDANPRP